MKRISITMAILLSAVAMHARTLVAYYSYTNNVERIVHALSSRIACDVVEIEPADKNLDYAANNYAIGSAQIAAIRNNPNDATSYPAIDPVDVNPDEYDMIIIAAPLWWSQMAAPMQTFLFNHGQQMAGKNIGMIVSSASSGINGVVADAKRLIPDGNFIEPNLWVRSSQTANATSLIDTWLNDIDYDNLSASAPTTATGPDLDITMTDGTISAIGDCRGLSLCNLSGYKVLETNGTSIDTSCVSPGIYIAQASDGTHSITRKIVLR